MKKFINNYGNAMMQGLIRGLIVIVILWMLSHSFSSCQKEVSAPPPCTHYHIIFNKDSISTIYYVTYWTMYNHFVNEQVDKHTWDTIKPGTKWCY